MQSQYSNNKRLVKNTMMLYMRQLFGLIVSLYTAGIVLRELGVENYGIYSIVGSIVSVFGFLQSSMTGSTQRFMNVEMSRGNQEQLKKVFSTSLVIHIVITSIVFILAETVGLWLVNNRIVIPAERISAANWVYQFSIVSAVFSIIQSPYNAAIIANEKMVIYGYFGIAQTLTTLLSVYLLITINIDKLILYSVLTLVVGGLHMVIYKVYCTRRFPECHFHMPYEKGLFKAILRFSGWNLFGSTASIGMNQGQNILLNLFFGPAVNATRAIATNVNSVVNQFVTNFMVALSPQITKSYAAGEHQRTNLLIFRGAKFSYFLLFVLASPVLVRTQEILVLWLKTPPEYTANFCRLALIDTLIITVSYPIMTGVASTGWVKRYQVVVGSILLLNIPVSYLFLRLGLPPVSVYFSAISISLIAFVVRVFMADRLLHFGKVKFFTDVFMRCWLIFIIAMPIEFYLSSIIPSTLPFLFVVIAISMAISAVTVLYIGMTKVERQFIVNAVRSKLTSI